ncbi:hypothetical protein PVAND_004278 [Polypedilum vanderplanki]|uniref:Neuroguidin n=1 Tax=Polypedilum vanderplanki TaxID=319348 RepID=A0A9J6BWN4_POLVA|nr:hypothetical protein PVAND_004278 [Polypedilum vanderplanki]
MVQATDEDYGVHKPDFSQALRLIDEMNNNVKQVSDVVSNMLQRVRTGELSTEFGLSFLEVKYHMLLNYLINLTYIVLRKCSGQRIEKDPSIDRLIEIRTILEKIRPIDHKLRYQIDKLVKTAITGTSSANDPLKFKANPSNLISQFDESDTSGSENDDEDNEQRKLKKKKKSMEDDGNEEFAKYVPPKITPMPYEDDESNAKKQRERARKRAINSALIDEWKEEFLDTPVEIMGSSRAQQTISKEMKERERYEEENFVRLPMKKAERERQRRLYTLGSLGDELTGFSANRNSSSRKRKASKKKGGDCYLKENCLNYYYFKPSLNTFC